MAEWLRLALSGAMVRRALLYTIIVGSILILINHGDALVSGDVDATALIKMGLTVMVPYLVSTFSSVGAICELRGANHTHER